jgi:ABC-type bacteriocin/lantibiotic exporter with double-glycine peptidase domain
MSSTATSRTPIHRLFRLLADERPDVGVVYFYAVLAGVLSLSLPLGIQAIIGLVSGGMLLQPVVILIGLVVAGTFAAGALQVLQLGVVERIQQRIFARHALELARDLPRTRLEALEGTDLPELTNRFFEVITIQKSLSKLLTESVAALLSIVAGLVLLTFYHPYLSLFGGALIVALAMTLWMTGRRGLETSLAESSAKYRVAHWLQELARHASSFHLAGETALPLARMDQEVDQYLGHRQDHFRVLARQSMAVVLLKTLVTGGLLIIGASLVLDRRISLGQFVASELVIVSVLLGVEKLIFSLSTVYDALTAAEKSSHLRDVPRSSHALEGAVERDAGNATLGANSLGVAVATTALHYMYGSDGGTALRDVSFQANAGERVALVGSEGAGASTLLRVLAGLQSNYQGAVTLDGRSLRDLPRLAISNAVSLVNPTPALIDGTIEDNVALGRSGIDRSAVADALELVGLQDFVHALSTGMQTRVGPGGVVLPSHVVRKILLARAVVSRPRLLLFDEFFHHVEPVAKRRLLDRLCDPTRGWTIIAASHDPAFLAACDRVLLLEDGRIVGEGTYETLRERLAERNLLRALPQARDADAFVPVVAVSGGDEA